MGSVRAHAEIHGLIPLAKAETIIILFDKVSVYNYYIIVMKYMYITNNPKVAAIAQKYGVDRIWVDLETYGKEERQRGMNTVKSQHCIDDIRRIKPLLSTSEMLVRVNAWHDKSETEIDEVIKAGADLIMLPMWRSLSDVKGFIDAVDGRAKTVLLLETVEAENCLDNVLSVCRPDEIHIGLNDLHLSYGLTFMFELLSNGTVERICSKLRESGIPYGFGGIAGIGSGLLPAQKILKEHFRLGSDRVILSRGFCNTSDIIDLTEIDRVFDVNMKKLRECEAEMLKCTQDDFELNKREIAQCVNSIVAEIKRNRSEI